VSVLDELRKMIEERRKLAGEPGLDAYFVGWDRAIENCLSVIGTFEAAHPGLEDSTAICHRCGRPCSGAWWETVYQNSAPGEPNFSIEHVCTTCLEEATE